MAGIVLNMSHRVVPGGAFSTVFLDKKELKAYKLFRRMTFDDKFPVDHLYNRIIAKAVWDSECEAFEIAGSVADLANHIPKFYSRVSVESVLESNGRDNSNEYHLDLGYCMELIEGEAEKYELVKAECGIEGERLINLFRTNKIDHLRDCSVFNWRSPKEVKFIDIAKTDWHSVLTSELADRGKLQDAHLNRWS